jgi:hypothetical protein
MQCWKLGAVLCLTLGHGSAWAETTNVEIREKTATTTTRATAKAVNVAIAVTDLTYTDSVKEYFQYTELHQKSDSRSRNQHQMGERTASGSSSSESHNSLDMVSSAGTYTHIDHGELRKMTADIKGEIIKTGAFRVTQARPYLRPEKTREEKALDLERAKKLMHPGAATINTQKSSPEAIYDIIDRIKKGYFPGADYVLFGTVNNIEFRNELNPIQGTNTASRSLSLDLIAEFSLINTRTYEVRAAFSAAGEGQDSRLVKAGVPAKLAMNRGKVIRETSQSLAVDVINQLTEQFDVGRPQTSTTRETRTENTQKVINFR